MIGLQHGKWSPVRQRLPAYLLLILLLTTSLPGQVRCVAYEDWEKEEKMSQHMNAGVLIVDDDPLVLASVQWTVARLGYKRIYTAGCAANARSLLLAHRFGLLIVDISLPDTDGRQLVREALIIHPGARAVLISGFIYRGLLIPKDLYGKVELLAKPFTEEELSELLAAAFSTAH